MKKKAKKAQSDVTNRDVSATEAAPTHGAFETTGDYPISNQDAHEQDGYEPTFEEPDDLPYTLSDVASVFEKLLSPEQNKKDPRLWDDGTDAK